MRKHKLDRRRRRLTEADLHPVSRAFWAKRGKLGVYPIALLVALDRRLDAEAKGWRRQLRTAFRD